MGPVPQNPLRSAAKILVRKSVFAMLIGSVVLHCVWGFQAKGRSLCLPAACALSRLRCRILKVPLPKNRIAAPKVVKQFFVWHRALALLESNTTASSQATCENIFCRHRSCLMLRGSEVSLILATHASLNAMLVLRMRLVRCCSCKVDIFGCVATTWT